MDPKSPHRGSGGLRRPTHLARFSADIVPMTFFIDLGSFSGWFSDDFEGFFVLSLIWERPSVDFRMILKVFKVETWGYSETSRRRFRNDKVTTK